MTPEEQITSNSAGSPPITAHSIYAMSELSEEQLDHEAALYGDLASAVRRVAEASLRTTVHEDAVREVTAALHAQAERLEAEMIDGSFGVSITRSGRGRAYGNAVVGLRNPIAVPLKIEHAPEGRAWASFRLNALHEGPPGLVHGGMVALILDQIFGEAAAAGGSPGMTGTLTLRYRAGTPLGDCSAEAAIDRVEGVKTFVSGAMRNAEGEVTVAAEGVFILPKWARKALDVGAQSPRVFE